MRKKIAAPAVERASLILDFLAKSDAPKSLAEITDELQLPKSSLHGLCATLSNLNLISKLDSGEMVLGPHVVMWANAFLARVDISKEFFASWDEMRVLPEETITLSVRDGLEVVYIACRNGTRPLGFTFKTGMRAHAIHTATGLAMLSTMPNQSVINLLNDQKDGWVTSPTNKGLKDQKSLLHELSQVRSRGYSIDHEAVKEGMYCFGAPVFDSYSPEAVAGVAVSILANEVDKELEEHAGRAIKKLADRLTQRLGGDITSKHAWHRKFGN